jgi:hypothetical protein
MAAAPPIREVIHRAIDGVAGLRALVLRWQRGALVHPPADGVDAATRPSRALASRAAVQLDGAARACAFDADHRERRGRGMVDGNASLRVRP